ncbi:MAG: glycosyltransferase [Bauldia litoralis]
MLALTLAAGLALAAWLYLALFNGRFWRADQWLDPAGVTDGPLPAVAAVVPARNEADVIGEAVSSLLGQDYAGPFTVIVVDDGSEDGTADAARAAATAAGRADRLSVIAADPLPEGWSGKLWAVHAGVSAAPAEAEFLLLTDADIRHDPGNLSRLVAKARHDRRDLVSLMVKLHCEGFAERLLIPAFVFFFQMLYPFPWVNDRRSRVAGAAGGCMLVRRSALRAMGGIGAIRGALIDDCTLARRLKAKGPIWLGLTRRTVSTRSYGGIGPIWSMVARTAYTQLRHNPLLLGGTVLGMVLLYIVPLTALVAGLALHVPLLAALGGAAVALMLALYWPTYRLYGPPGAGFWLLPLAGLLYTAMTVDSARRHARGAGGGWKGRTYGAATRRDMVNRGARQ